MKLTEATIQESLKLTFSQPRFLLKNLYVFGWESDFLILTKSGYWYETEIKISRADFKNDFKHKEDKHNKALSNKENNHKPNYFSYGVPENMISLDEVPEYAGLIYIYENGSSKTIKSPPKLHKEKIDPNTLGLLDKFYWNMINAKISEKNTKLEMKRLKEKYKDMAEVESYNQNIGFERCYSLATESFMKNCKNYQVGEDKWTVTCLRDNSVRHCGRCSGNCEEIEKFLDTLYGLKK